jgi:hypothetical protein
MRDEGRGTRDEARGLRAGPCRPGVAGGLARRLVAAERRVRDEKDCTSTMDNGKSQLGATLPVAPIDNRRKTPQN